ncbi:MAG TPA: tripartite tricarboxylate transporter substrate binding protein [Ideonella sp.]|nr:tripartite tricarboxylate transporter substrate binding protein [Ideonella sp.]
MQRRHLLGAAAAAALPWPLAAHAAAYPDHPVELIVPYQAGGGTDALARAFADAARKHFAQPLVVYNKPGASGAIGWSDVINGKADGYKLAVITVELTTLPHLGLARFTHEEFTPIARLNADPAAITVKADAPWNTVEEFLAAAKKPGADLKMGNSGNGSIWHLAAAALEDKTGARFSHIPFQGAGPAVLALMGGHIDAVSVSPAEVTTFVNSGKLKMLAVMADQRTHGFDKVPTLKERGIDLSVGTWRGLGVAKATPRDIVEQLKTMTQQTMAEPAMREAMDKLNLGTAYGDEATFKAVLVRDHEAFKLLIPKLGLKG